MSQNLPATPAPHLKDVKVAILSAEWNGHINQRMVDSAESRLKELGASFKTFYCPGAIELTFGASQLVEASLFDTVIVFGTVIRGGTPHFDYVCQSVTQGITTLNADCDTPIIFGVLTVDNEQDALDRAGGSHGDKGSECADAAIKMVALQRQIQEL